jgi:hypothetical protein
MSLTETPAVRAPLARVPLERAPPERVPAEPAAAGRPATAARKIRTAALALTGLALAVYFGFIALVVYRSHH